MARVTANKLHSNIVRADKVFQDFFSGSGEVAYENEITIMVNEEVSPGSPVTGPDSSVIGSKIEEGERCQELEQNRWCRSGKRGKFLSKYRVNECYH